MTTRDAYVALLEKRASSEGDALHESVPQVNNEQVAVQELGQNQEDNRAYLHSIFSQAGAVQNNQSAELKKLFPNMPSGTTTRNPLIKVAGRGAFFSLMQNHGKFMKVASPIHREVTFNAFCDELGRIHSSRNV